MLKVVHINRPNNVEQLAERLLAKWERKKLNQLYGKTDLNPKNGNHQQTGKR